MLPDERVVLYQKCTETLLNTWHTWKYRTEDSRNRGRIEKQNRARMEAIAYWMHTAFDTADPTGRAVAAHDDLVKFLTRYIAEEDRSGKGDPRKQAELFLRFVCERAGLLNEVGEAKYSFLHLTFQEYLAATYLRKTGELGGMEVVWQVIGERCGHPRWHEVIRLLIGSLEKEESQAFFLEKILDQENDLDFLERAILAGGCLLDHIPTAEDMADRILRCLLLAARKPRRTKRFRASSASCARSRSESRSTWANRHAVSFPDRRVPGCRPCTQPGAHPGRDWLV